MVTSVLRTSHNWEEFNARLSSLSNKQKGDAFERLAEHYLCLDPKYATALKHVWRLAEVPTKVRKHLQLPDLDEGIDLVAQTNSGTYWAIQCKYREDSTKSLTRKELSTFTDLAFTICKNFEYALVCTTADRFSNKLKKYGERLGFCAGDAWTDLDEEFFRHLHRLLNKKVVTIQPFTPRPHQHRAILNAKAYFVDNRHARGKLIHPCGSGKSLTAYWIARAANAKTILVAVPSLALIRQNLHEWARELLAENQKVHWLAVCSDESVGHAEDNDVSVLTQDLGVKVHTKTKEVTDWLKRPHRGLKVVFTTYQSGKITAKASKRACITFDFAIFDEAHKTVGSKTALFSHLLFDKNIEIKKRLFMTATERRYRGSSNRVISMDQHNIYGETFELLSFKAALESDPPILSDYQIVTMIVSRHEIAELVTENAFVRPDRGAWNEDIEARTLAALVALRKAIKKYRIKHAVSFHGSISKAVAFADSQAIFSSAFPSYGKLSTYHVSGKTPTAIRARQIRNFSSERKALITNARCLTEGVDVPAIDCVLFTDPKRSTVDIVQAVGRALRRSEGKKLGYVIVPVLADESDELTIGDSEFSELVTILRALASNDERIVEYFRSVSEKAHWKGTKPVSFSVSVSQDIDTNLLLDALQLRTWDRLAKLSWRPFEEAKTFVQNLKIQNYLEWFTYCKGDYPDKPKKPSDIPTAPNLVYAAQGWSGYRDWLGTGRASDYFGDYFSYVGAREFVHSLELNSRENFFNYRHGKLAGKPPMPDQMPHSPEKVYKEHGWVGWGDFLGTGRRRENWREFEEARKFARSLRLSNVSEWRLYCVKGLSGKPRKPEDIPTNPYEFYKDKGWISFGDWLGTRVIARSKQQYRSFQSTRKFVRSLGLTSTTHWQRYSKGELTHMPKFPDDIPVAADRVYRDVGWQGWGDFLGTGRVADRFRLYRRFQLARKFARSLGLSTMKEWSLYCRQGIPGKPPLPEDVPAQPWQTYKQKGYVHMGDWLGTGFVPTNQRAYRSFSKARKFVRSLKLSSQNEWRIYCREGLPGKPELPDDIPATPRTVYKDKGWKSEGDWLGTSRVATRSIRYRSFTKARKFARSLDLKTRADWNRYCNGQLDHKPVLPSDIPKTPDQTYREKGWKGMGDWLGTGYVHHKFRQYRRFGDAQSFVRALGLRSNSEWVSYCRGEIKGIPKLPKDIPKSPERTYRSSGWRSWPDWLGTENLPYAKARSFARTLKLQTWADWNRYCNGKISGLPPRPLNIPKHPASYYKDKGWKGMGDWLGTN